MLLGICKARSGQIDGKVFNNDSVFKTYLEQDNAGRQELLSNIELILSDADVLEEIVGECAPTMFRKRISKAHQYEGRGVSHVAAIQLESEESDDQEWHDDEVDPAEFLAKQFMWRLVNTHLRTTFFSSSSVQSG